jgi:hypothetical protein
MLTILTRIFPYDISEYIYQIYKNDVIEVIMYPKLYTLELILDKFIKDYLLLNRSQYPGQVYCINNIEGIRFIKKVFQLIKKYNYQVDKELESKIVKFREILQNKNQSFDDQFNSLIFKLIAQDTVDLL